MLHKTKFIISRAGDKINAREFFSASSTDEKKEMNMLKRIKHTMVKFIPAEETAIKGNDFESLCKSVISKLGESFVGIPCRLKVIKNGNYSKVAPYMPFLELQSVKVSNLKMSDKEYEGTQATSLQDFSDDGEIAIPDEIDL